MPNRNAEKIRRRREKSLEDKTPAAESNSKNWRFWILLVVLFSTTAYPTLNRADLSEADNTFERLTIAIIDDRTKLSDNLESRRVELFELSKKNREKRQEFLDTFSKK